MKSALLLMVLLTLGLARDGEEERLQARARVDVQRFYDGELDLLWEEFDEKLRASLGSLENFGRFHQQAVDQLGNETRILRESLTAVGGGWSYVRVATFEKLPERKFEVILGYDAQEKATGFLIRPVPTEAPTKYLDYVTRTELRLPFEGEWTVVWGGRTLEVNYHTAYPDQRFAYDILATKDGATHTGEGKQNADYFCFGRPILAPAAGKVVVAVDGVEDNVPGEMNPRQAAGNHVILDHGNGEYSLLAHFQKGSLAVEAGAQVVPGQRLGLCGNSGNSTEPHLHFHLQTTGVFGKGDGLPAPFVDYLADGQRVERGEPVKGQHIRRP